MESDLFFPITVPLAELSFGAEGRTLEGGRQSWEVRESQPGLSLSSSLGGCSPSFIRFHLFSSLGAVTGLAGHS